MKRLTTHQAVAIFVAVPITLLVFFSLNLFGFFGTPRGAQNGTEAAVFNGSLSGSTVITNDTVVGTGAEALPGMLLTVHYVGFLTDGRVFDSSVERGPFQFVLGAGQVIPGWEQGLLGMKVGGRRSIVIPPELGYGAAGIGPIPGNATLLFEVELLEAVPAQ